MEDIKKIKLSEIEQYEIKKKQIAKCIKERYDKDPVAKAKREKQTLDYSNKRYHTDPDFREKMKKHQRDLYYKKKENRLIEMQVLKDAEELKLKEIEDKFEKLITF